MALLSLPTLLTTEEDITTLAGNQVLHYPAIQTFLPQRHHF